MYHEVDGRVNFNGMNKYAISTFNLTEPGKVSVLSLFYKPDSSRQYAEDGKIHVFDGPVIAYDGGSLLMKDKDTRGLVEFYGLQFHELKKLACDKNMIKGKTLRREAAGEGLN